MSYTAVYSPLIPLDRDTSREGAKILDRDKLDQWASEFDAENILDDAEIKGRKELTEYPRQEWDYLLGFRTWKPREPSNDHDKSTLGAYHNIERLGFWYGGNFTSFWAGLSIATEPFELYHPAPEHGLRESGRDIIRESTTAADDGRREPADGGIDVAHVRACDGTATVDVMTLAVSEVQHGVDEATVEIDMGETADA